MRLPMDELGYSQMMQFVPNSATSLLHNFVQILFLCFHLDNKINTVLEF